MVCVHLNVNRLTSVLKVLQLNTTFVSCDINLNISYQERYFFHKIFILDDLTRESITCVRASRAFHYLA